MDANMHVHVPCVNRDLDNNTKTHQAQRACHQKYWQPDNEVTTCSMSNCTNQFASNPLWSLINTSLHARHHCRKCGVLVCGLCSQGRRKLFPPNVGRGNRVAPQLVRVCNACFFNEHEILDFDVPQKVEQEKFAVRKARQQIAQKEYEEWMSQTASDFSRWRDGEQFSTTNTPCESDPEDWNELQMHMTKYEDNCDEDERSAADTPPDQQVQEDAHHNTETISPSLLKFSIKGVNVERSVGCAAQLSVVGETAVDVGNCVVDEERFLQLEQTLRSCSYYEGMSHHEPLALKALMSLAIA
eukprot:CAMPEP_0181299006 /NCGR_PEP_ID=MMETSP1101-20121128/6099_1 /TAXON_ID=46948 /ORGANISM="Rhodomonas abbreviata, Strain Caron Lab Isolate" /LENGTH=298 /DNA_ID=CAMNT_0023404093 /DNA_START=98 /DNA_END=994 /DNA_ORIENTATION=+